MKMANGDITYLGSMSDELLHDLPKSTVQVFFKAKHLTRRIN